MRRWLAHTPSIPEDGKHAARANAESRYKSLVEHVTQRDLGGRRFLDDLSREQLADEAELAAVARGAADADLGKP